MSRPRASTRSAVRCGRGGVPAGRGEPDLQHVARRGDRRRPGCRACRPPAAGRSAARRSGRRPSIAPSATMSSAPPGWTSSAGWKISRTRPGSAGADGQREAGAEQHRGVRVVPAGVHHAVRRWRRTGSPVSSCSGQRVQVGAQRDAAARRSRCRRPGRCRRAGCGARGRPRSAAGRPARWCGARRGRARAARGSPGASRRRRRGARASQESSQAGPLPAPRSATARSAGITRSVCASSRVTGHHRPVAATVGRARTSRTARRGCSVVHPSNGAHPDGGVPTGMGRFDRNPRRGVVRSAAGGPAGW